MFWSIQFDVNTKLNKNRDTMLSLFADDIFALLLGNLLECTLTPGRSLRHATVFAIGCFSWNEQSMN